MDAALTPGFRARFAELANVDGGCSHVTPEELRKEAAAAESMARIVSYQPDKRWLEAKAAELRHQADRMEARSWAPAPPRGRGR